LGRDVCGCHYRFSKRIYEHKEGAVTGFTQKYRLKRLVYFEVFSDVTEAIHREKQLKRYQRAYKFNLITQDNPEWRDLYLDIL
jgi:putative endonuclease